MYGVNEFEFLNFRITTQILRIPVPVDSVARRYVPTLRMITQEANSGGIDTDDIVAMDEGNFSSGGESH